MHLFIFISLHFFRLFILWLSILKYFLYLISKSLIWILMINIQSSNSSIKLFTWKNHGLCFDFLPEGFFIFYFVIAVTFFFLQKYVCYTIIIYFPEQFYFLRHVFCLLFMILLDGFNIIVKNMFYLFIYLTSILSGTQGWLLEF